MNERGRRALVTCLLGTASILTAFALWVLVMGPAAAAIAVIAAACVIAALALIASWRYR